MLFLGALQQNSYQSRSFCNFGRSSLSLARLGRKILLNSSCSTCRSVVQGTSTKTCKSISALMYMYKSLKKTYNYNRYIIIGLLKFPPPSKPSTFIR